MAYTQTNTGLIDIDQFSYPSDMDKFRAGIEIYLKNKQGGIVFSKPKLITDTIELPSHMLLGCYYNNHGYGKKFNLVIDLKDKEKTAFKCLRRGTSYTERHELFNLNIDVVSECGAVIRAENGSEQTFKNVLINCQGLAKYGIVIGNDDERHRSVDTKLESVDVREATEAGVYFNNTGRVHYLSRCHLRRNQVGLLITNGSDLIIQNSKIESNVFAAIIARGIARLSIQNTIFEKGYINVSEAKMFSMFNCKHSGRPIVLQCQQASFIGNEIYQGDLLFPEGNPIINFQGNEIPEYYYNQLRQKFAGRDNGSVFLSNLMK